MDEVELTDAPPGVDAGPGREGTLLWGSELTLTALVGEEEVSGAPCRPDTVVNMVTGGMACVVAVVANGELLVVHGVMRDDVIA